MEDINRADKTIKMTTSELRIGNWVIFGDGFPEQVTLENFITLNKYEDRTEWIKPIPLTPEILEKAGFSFIGGDNEHYNKEEIAIFSDGEVTFDYCGIEAKILYVHQLQNLYFALTGEELEIKL